MHSIRNDSLCSSAQIQMLTYTHWAAINLTTATTNQTKSKLSSNLRNGWRGPLVIGDIARRNIEFRLPDQISEINEVGESANQISLPHELLIQNIIRLFALQSNYIGTIILIASRLHTAKNDHAFGTN